ncbi:MAG: hypothetical protein EA406_07705 [Rhodospirillales bacterium]|nr:MAG: hypothetical protein EA406_07705 [Rhodospirillales bacterium]
MMRALTGGRQLLELRQVHDSQHRRPAVPALPRRGFLAGGLAVAGLAATMGRAGAFQVMEIANPFPRVPERDGALPWRVLAGVEGDGWIEPFRFSPDIKALNGTMVTVDGYMLSYDDAPKQREFLLTAYQAHCPFCMPGGMMSMIDVSMDLPIPVSEGIVTVRGPLTVIEEEGYGLLYAIPNAAPV